MRKLVILSLPILLAISCAEDFINFQENYINALSQLEISCDSGISEIYLKCELGDDKVCHFEGADNRTFAFLYSTNFVTKGTSFISNDTVTILGKRGSVTFADFDDPNQDAFRIWFPLVSSETSKTEYLADFF